MSNNSRCITCYGCGFDQATIIYEQKYKGWRGFCPNCYGNWPES